MPRILELKEIKGQLWARIPSFCSQNEDSVTLWTEAEKAAALGAERDRCVYAIEVLGREDLLHRVDELVRNLGMSDAEPAD